MLLSLTFSACGSGGGSSPSEHKTSIQEPSQARYLVDSAIQGVTYKTKDFQGVTDSNGRFFIYGDNSKVEFFIGNLKVGIYNPAGKTDDKASLWDIVQDISVSRGDDNPNVLKLAVLFQSLDDDKNSNNGINITKTTKELFTKEENIKDIDLSDIESTVQEKLDTNFTLKSEDEAKAHIKKELEKITSKPKDDVEDKNPSSNPNSQKENTSKKENPTDTTNQSPIKITSTSKAEFLGVLKTGQTISYENKDDGTYQSGQSRNFTRAKGIVTDHTTGLQWQDDYSDNSGVVPKKPWVLNSNFGDKKYMDISGDTAYNYCFNLRLNGDNWRLPTLMELLSIVDISTKTPALNSIFENTQGVVEYWSSSTYIDSNDKKTHAWYMNVGFGETSYHVKTNKKHIRCVRKEK